MHNYGNNNCASTLTRFRVFPIIQRNCKKLFVIVRAYYQKPLTSPMKCSIIAFLSFILWQCVSGFSSGLLPMPRSARPKDSPCLQAAVNEKEQNTDVSRDRRNILTGLALLSAGFLNIRARDESDYSLYNILPVGPYKRKKTIFNEIVPDYLWTGDQKFGILNVQVPLRMSIVRLSTGGMLVYNPLAATREVVSFVRNLEQKYGAPVKHIVLGSVAIEHKVYAGVFAQQFPRAKVWIAPGQYSFPINLPVQFLGFPIGRTYTIPLESDVDQDAVEWKEDFLFQTLGPFISKDGAFCETVLYHKATKSLLVTDTVLEVTEDVPEIYNNDPKPLLYHARDTVTDVVSDTPATRQKGWRRVSLFGLFFTPGAIQIKDGCVLLYFLVLIACRAVCIHTI